MRNPSQIIFTSIYLIVILGMLIPTVMTLLPHDASKPNHWGYKSMCAFAPWSTLSLLGILSALVGLVYLIQILVERS